MYGYLTNAVSIPSVSSGRTFSFSFSFIHLENR